MKTNRLTIGLVLQRLTEQAGRLEQTVDKLIFGSPETEVSGIVTTFLATQHVLEQAARLGANLVVSHEGVFYSHHGQTEFMADDSVYVTKRQWIEKSGIAVFRFHDHLHRYRPDAITEALVQALDWSPYVEEHLPTASILSLPVMSLCDIVEDVKMKLGLPYVRVVGDPAALCSRVGLLAGYRGGGATAIPLFESRRLDLVIAGEGPEWETPEYVRDAVHQGRCRAAVFLGHAASEEPGMRKVKDLLKNEFPGVPVHFVAETPLFQIM